MKNNRIKDIEASFPPGAKVAVARGIGGFSEKIHEIGSLPFYDEKGRSILVMLKGSMAPTPIEKLALAPEDQPTSLRHRLASGRISSRKVAMGKEKVMTATGIKIRTRIVYFPFIDGIPIHCPENPSGFEKREDATKWAQNFKRIVSESLERKSILEESG